MTRKQTRLWNCRCTLLLSCIALIVGCGNKPLTETHRSAKTDGTIYNGTLVNDRLGVAVGEIGNVRYSRDGGKTWEKGENTSLCLFGLTVLDDTTFIATGNGSSVRITVDGGETWKALANIPAARGKGLSFLSRDMGWVWSKGALFETVNGGASWTTIPLPQGMAIIESAIFQDSGIGLICGIDGMIYRTVSAGKTWETVASYANYRETGFVQQKASDNQTTAFRIQGDTGVLVTIGLVKGKSALYSIRTIDGGLTRTRPELYFPKVTPLAVSFLPSMALSTFNLDSSISRYLIR